MTAAAADSMPQRPRLVVVDDATELLDLFRDLLTPRYELVALDGTGLDLDELAALEPDLLIVDFNLPGTNGLDLVRSARSVPGLRDVPVLLLSADPRALLEGSGGLRAIGGIEVLPKPFAIEELEAAVRRGVVRGPERQRRESSADTIEREPVQPQERSRR